MYKILDSGRISSKNDDSILLILQLVDHAELLHDALDGGGDRSVIHCVIKANMNADGVSALDHLQIGIDESLSEHTGLKHGGDARRVPLVYLRSRCIQKRGVFGTKRAIPDQSSPHHVRQHQQRRPIELVGERLVVGDSIQLLPGVPHDSVVHAVGDVCVMVQADELLASFQGQKNTCRGKQVDWIGEVVQRKRKEMIGEIRSNN